MAEEVAFASGMPLGFGKFEQVMDGVIDGVTDRIYTPPQNERLETLKKTSPSQLKSGKFMF